MHYWEAIAGGERADRQEPEMEATIKENNTYADKHLEG